MKPSLYLGTSGWSYPGWKNDFYAGVRHKDWLSYYAQHFSAVEINASFYRQQLASTYARWCKETPPNFHFTMKGNRYITHIKRLKDPHHALGLEMASSTGFADKLTAVLWQLPAALKKNLERLQGFAAALAIWPEVRHVMEFRHPSWFDSEVAECLNSYGLANVMSDAADWPLWEAVTTNLVYIRLHGHTRTYASAYSSRNLSHWAGRIGSWLDEGRDVHVYFDNDSEGAAPHDAMRLMKLLSR